MLKQIGRPSPALVISLIALFVALGGTVYAAGHSGKINGKTIKVKSIPGNRLKPNTVTGKQVKESSLGLVPLAGEAVNARTAQNSESTVNALESVRVDGHEAGCPAGTQDLLGGCWETAPRPAATAISAAETCGNAGATLPQAFQLAFVSHRIPLGSTDEWTDDINTVTGLNSYTVITVSKSGEINETNAIDTKEYRCVVPLVR